MIVTPCCEAELDAAADMCPVCMRNPQERAAWLIEKWRSEGSFEEPPPEPSDEAEEQARKLLPRYTRKAQLIGANAMRRLPEVEVTIGDLDFLANLLEDDDHELWTTGSTSEPKVQAIMWRNAESEANTVEQAEMMTVVCPCEKGHGPGSPRWVEVFSCELGQTVGRCECQDKTLTIPPRPSRAALESAWAEDERQWHQHQDAWSLFPPRFEDIGDGQRADVNSGARLRMLRRKGSSNGGQESGARVISLAEGRRRHRGEGGSQT